jgi:hypothetical protein
MNKLNLFPFYSSSCLKVNIPQPKHSYFALCISHTSIKLNLGKGLFQKSQISLLNCHPFSVTEVKNQNSEVASYEMISICLKTG